MLKSLLESCTAEKEAAAQKQVWLDPAEVLQNPIEAATFPVRTDKWKDHEPSHISSGILNM